jgi:hypothetical protein
MTVRTPMQIALRQGLHSSVPQLEHYHNHTIDPIKFSQNLYLIFIKKITSTTINFYLKAVCNCHSK